MEHATVAYAPDRSVSLGYRWHGGAPSSLPLVCLHGSMCDTAFFDLLDGALPGYRCLCIELPGHGSSDPVPGAPVALEQMASAIRSLLVELGLTTSDWAIAGHSLGGAVALLVIELTATKPLVEAERLPLFFLSVEGNATPADCAAGGLSRRVAAMPQPPSAEETLQMVSSEAVWLASARDIGETVGLLAHGIWISLVEWCDGRTLDGANLEEMQRRVPLRYLYGSKSGKYHESNQAAIAAHPDARAAGVEGAGHFMLTDDPPAALAAVRELLAGFLSKE